MAAAIARIAVARERMTPRLAIVGNVERGDARRAWGTVRRVRRCSVSTGSPKARAKRPASVRAAFTVICWPSTARTASSKPSKAPGRRNPGAADASGPSDRGDETRIDRGVEQPLRAQRHVGQGAGEPGRDREPQAAAFRRVRDLDPAAVRRVAVHAADGARVATVGDDLDPVDGPGREKAEQGVEVVRRAAGEQVILGGQHGRNDSVRTVGTHG
jgi:hypothetical protein